MGYKILGMREREIGASAILPPWGLRRDGRGANWLAG